MKNILNIFFFLCVATFAYAQETYTINAEQIALENEVTGTLSLYYSKVDGSYRYFVAKNNVFEELVSTRNSDGDPQFEYKTVLTNLTADAPVSVEKTDLTLGSLTDFVVAYNTQKDSSYTYENKHFQLGMHLGVLGGISNNIFTTNADNVMAPQIVAELEFFNAIKPTSRHSGFIHLKQTFEADNYDYTSTQLSINYRFKIVRNTKFSLYAQAKPVTFTRASLTYSITDEEGNIATYTDKGFDFDMPFFFGVGADYKIGNNTFITLQYNDIVALNFDSNGEFPVDLNLGVKFTL